MKISPQTLQQRKNHHHPVVMVTCYDYPHARLLERAGAEVLLVGDSVGTNVLGYSDVRQVTLADMAHHTGAVARGAQRSFVLTDLPYNSCTTPERAVASARMLQEAGADGVKLEGEHGVEQQLAALVSEGIPVCGHIGYTPQTMAIPAVQGKDFERGCSLLRAAGRLSAQGIFMLVLELIPQQLAALITRNCPVPTIGIGAGGHCDGQVQVLHDIVGLSEKIYRHAQAYAAVGNAIEQAAGQYARQVVSREFPTANNSASIDKDLIQRLERWLTQPETES